MTRVQVLATLALLAACTPHDELASEPPPPFEAPAVVIEPEPEAPLPAIIAPPLPELAPTRPLANLDVLWTDTNAEQPYPDTLWVLGRSLLAMHFDDAQALGVPGPLLYAEGPDMLDQRSLHGAGPLVVVPAQNGEQFTAVAREDGKVAWVASAKLGRSYMQIVTPRALLASFYGASGDALLAWALEHGQQMWVRTGENAGFTRISKLWSDDVRGYIRTDLGVEAFDPDTGRALWAATISDPACGVASGEGLVVIEDRKGHLMLDAESGELRGRIGAPALACGWDYYSYGMVVAPAVLSGGRMFAFDVVPDNPNPNPNPGRLRALSLADGRELWSVGDIDEDVLFVDHDAVFVMRNHNELVALAAESGVEQTAIMIGSSFSLRVEPLAGERGPLLLIEDDERGWWVLGRGEQPAKRESFEVRGRMVPDPGLQRRRVAGMRLEVAGQIVETDGKGRFVVRGQGRGLVNVEPLEIPDVDQDDWTSVGFDRVRVMLDGRGRYDVGDIVAYQMSME